MEDTTYCNGADPQIVASLYCLIPMTELRSSPYSLLLGNLTVAKVRASNMNGWSAYSVPNLSGAGVQTEPQQMTAVTRGPSTSQTSIEVDWVTALTSPANGGATVVSYKLQYDSGSNGASWTSLTGAFVDSMASSYIVTSGILPGTTYGFRVGAKNAWGYGPYSATTFILASSIPA